MEAPQEPRVLRCGMGSGVPLAIGEGSGEVAPQKNIALSSPSDKIQQTKNFK